MKTKTAPTTATIVGKRKDEADYIKEYPHIVKGSLRYDAKLLKQVVTIKTIGINGKFDGDTREIATSDLHHTRHTEDVAKQVRLSKIRESRKARREAAPKKTVSKKLAAAKA